MIFIIKFFLPKVFEIMCTSTWPVYRDRHGHIQTFGDADSRP